MVVGIFGKTMVLVVFLCMLVHDEKRIRGFSWGMGGLTSVEVDIPHLYHIGNTSM